MKWTVNISDDGTVATVTDHNDEQVTTIDNDGGGFNQQDALDVMFDEAAERHNAAGGSVTDHVLMTLACAAFEQIEVVR